MANQWILITMVSMISLASITESRPHGIQIDTDDDDKTDRLTESIYAGCDPCPAGWGVKTLCNASHNTICTPCPSGSWSPKRPHFRPCSPCSKCGDGLFEDLPCSSTRDTVCDSCSNVKGHFNEDFKKKCDWKHVPESMKDQDEEEPISIGDQDQDESISIKRQDQSKSIKRQDQSESINYQRQLIDDHDQSISITDQDQDYAEVRFVDKKTGRPMTLKAISDRLKQLGFGADHNEEEDLEIDDPNIDDDLNRPIGGGDNEDDDDDGLNQPIGDDDLKVIADIGRAIDLDQLPKKKPSKSKQSINQISKPSIDLNQYQERIDDEVPLEQDDQVVGDHFIDMWSRVVQMRRRAQDTDRLGQKSQPADLGDEADDEDEDDDAEDDEETDALLHGDQGSSSMVRPVKAVVPSGEETFDDSLWIKNDRWQEDPVKKVAKGNRLEVNYPPSFHDYPIESLMHQQRRKMFIMMALTSCMLITAIVFITCYVRSYRRRKFGAYNRVTLVNLSPEEQEIVRQSATQLASVQEKPLKRFQFAHESGYSKLVNVETTSTPQLAVRQNPFDAYLNGEDIPVTRIGQGQGHGQEEVKDEAEKEVRKL